MSGALSYHCRNCRTTVGPLSDHCRTTVGLLSDYCRNLLSDCRIRRLCKPTIVVGASSNCGVRVPRCKEVGLPRYSAKVYTNYLQSAASWVQGWGTSGWGAIVVRENPLLNL